MAIIWTTTRLPFEPFEDTYFWSGYSFFFKFLALKKDFPCRSLQLATITYHYAKAPIKKIGANVQP